MEFLVRRNDLTKYLVREAPLVAVRAGEVLVRVLSFAFTSNNISYAVTGDSLRYWDFFPVEGAGDEAPTSSYGIIPVWGVGEVVVSRSAEIDAGERLYGYFPMSSYATLQPSSVSDASFVDASEHRQHLPFVYNQYGITRNDSFYSKQFEQQMCLLRPLYLTSWLIDDFLASNDFFGATQVVLSSGSSKTSLALAYQLQQRDAVRIVALTSPSHVEFVEGTKLYDEVLTYDTFDESFGGMDNQAVFVDMAGNRDVLTRIHTTFGDRLKYSCIVGATHWDQGGAPSKSLPGPKPVFFFAPTHAEGRIKDWGPSAFMERVTTSWHKFLPTTEDWLTVDHCHGSTDAARVYEDTLAGSVHPNVGHTVSLETVKSLPLVAKL